MKIWHRPSSKCRKSFSPLGQTSIPSIPRSPMSQSKTLSSTTYSWNFGKLTRIRAEQLLTDELIGTFLIRESEHYPGDMTLSIKDDAKIQHYRIKLDSNRQTYTVDDETFFHDLGVLVEVRIYSIVLSSISSRLALQKRCRRIMLSIGESIKQPIRHC